MAQRVLEKAPRFERMYRIWEYLKKNTDQEHPTTQAQMRQDSSVRQFVGNKQTFNRLIKDMANSMNSDENGICKSEEEWRIVFDDYRKAYGDDAEDIESDDDMILHIQNLYYQSPFTYEDVDCIIEGIYANEAIDSHTATRLVDKVEEELCSKYYKKLPRHICKIRGPELLDRELLRMNLQTIQKAIDNNVQIAFRFYGYSCCKKLEPVRQSKDVVSPYYIVVSGGRYYLFACKEIVKDGHSVKKMSIWRIDLMKEVEIPDANDKLGIPGRKRIPKTEVENLPLEWSEDFQLKHLNMSFDKPITITIRIKSTMSRESADKKTCPDYTFLHDWFGNCFRYIKTEEEAPYCDIVKVECSPFGMVNWALQYSDRVEVLEPAFVRERVAEKVRKLNEKYNV